MDRDEISKSERKRQAARLQTLGQTLAGLSAEQLAEIDLPAELSDALADYHRFSSHEAKRRQLQFIGKLMRGIDVEHVEAHLERLAGHSAEERYRQHQLESWRERLLAEPEALTDYLAEHPHTDRPQLRHHIQRVTKARDVDQRRHAARALFRFLRDNDSPDQPV